MELLNRHRHDNLPHDFAMTGTAKPAAGVVTPTMMAPTVWTAWTPTVGGAGWALGNGTITGSYVQLGKLVTCRVLITWGTTSTFGASALTLTSPVNSLSTAAVGTTIATHAGSIYVGFCYPATATTIQPLTIASAAGLSGVVSTSSPFAWVSTDTLIVSLTYEAA